VARHLGENGCHGWLERKVPVLDEKSANPAEVDTSKEVLQIMFSTYLRFRCFEAFEIIDRFLLKPCASSSSHFRSTLISRADS